MISIANFKELLKILCFTHDDNETFFEYNFEDCILSVDFNNNGKLIYPEQIRGREHNTLFNANENFVVFECVYRLLKKGYKPEDIELEKAWQLGRVQKGGRADICVYEKDSDNVLMIIECKTSGKEFENAKHDTKTDGAQLFSYWQQEISAKWLVLYTSDLKDGKIIYESPAIDCIDDKNLIARSGHDDTIKLYVNANTAKEKFSVWHDTYNFEIHDDVIFSPLSSAYDIGIRPLRKRDLKIFSEDDTKGIINSFEEILRHNNVSDKENAFNRLIALFICKLVDEIMKNEDDELEFQYKPRKDNYEDLQDRLQRLYTEGMMKFMHEEVTYIPADYPEKLFSNYTGENRNKAIEDLKLAFKTLKFYSNNSFAFKEVHNEELFYQNGKIIVEVVQLFQRYKIVHQNKDAKESQLLGDLFEQLLDKGFKQNEGQFFTPIPITRFIWDCIPLKKFDTLLRVIDYACGAGHFLIEAIEAINYFMGNKNNSWTRDYIFGIEKDYRLARVSKVSMFMNGAGDSNIIFGDGLENSYIIKPGTFDILTANPPYSVASFSQHLRLKENEFALRERIGTNGSEIEVLFVERIAQLLNSGGIAAVILPSSILSNDSFSYTGAREEILKNFMIRAIVQFGSKTFGATGTNTVVMFLEKYKEPPKRYALVQDSVDAILAGRNLDDWEDKYILEGYIAMQGISQKEWRDFVNECMNEDMPEYFRNYFDAFNETKEAKNIASSKLSPEEQKNELRWRFYRFAKKIESEKLFYYGLTYSKRTVVIISPSDNAGQKEFLGYDWSNRKGDEGIKIAVRGGKLYDYEDREAAGTLAHVVRQSYFDDDITITEDNARFARVLKTCEMIDFSRVNFNKAMRVKEHKGFDIHSRYNEVKLITVAKMNIPKSEAKEYPEDLQASFIEMSSVSPEGRIINMTDKPLKELWAGSYSFFREGDIISAKMMSSAENMKCTVAEGLTNKIGFGSSEFYTFRCDNEKIITRYLFEFLNMRTVREAAWASVTGTGRLRVPSRFYETMNIPLPPMEIQNKIVNECAEIDKLNENLRAEIAEYHEQIEGTFRELEAIPHTPLNNVISSVTDRINTTQIENSQYVTTDTMLQRCEGIRTYTAELPTGSVIKFQPGDILLSNIRPYLQKLWFADFDGGCSPDVLVFRSKNENICAGRYIYYALRRNEFFDFVMQDVKGIKMPRGKREHILDYAIPFPSHEEQKNFLDKVLKLENEISNAKNKLQSLSGAKESILKKYLS